MQALVIITLIRMRPPTADDIMYYKKRYALATQWLDKKNNKRYVLHGINKGHADWREIKDVT